MHVTVDLCSFIAALRSCIIGLVHTCHTRTLNRNRLKNLAAIQNFQPRMFCHNPEKLATKYSLKTHLKNRMRKVYNTRTICSSRNACFVSNVIEI